MGMGDDEDGIKRGSWCYRVALLLALETTRFSSLPFSGPRQRRGGEERIRALTAPYTTIHTIHDGASWIEGRGDC